MTGSVLGWTDLRDEVVARLADATGPGIDQWQKILTLVDARIGEPARGDAPPLHGRRWTLASVRVAGFRGVGGVLELDLDPTDGLTVLHAPNGTGKSSITEAVRATLAGELSPDGRSLWRPVDRAVTADHTTAETTLVCGADRLVLRWDDETGSSASHVANGGERSVTVTDPDWSSAVVAFTPVYSYAQTQERLGRSADLHGYLEDLLALGPCFALLANDVAEHARSATAAVDRLHELKYLAEAAVNKVDARFRDEPVALPPIKWPRIWTEDVHSWSARHELDGETTVATFRLPDGAADRIRTVANDVVDALTALGAEQADLAIDPQVQHALLGLHRAADGMHPGSCPVCHTDTDWFAALSATVSQLDGWEAARRAVTDRHHILRPLLREHVLPLLEAADTLGLGRTDLARSIGHLEMVTPGTPEHMSVLSAVAVELTGDHFADLVSGVAAHGERLRQWMAQRQAAVAEMASVWRDTGELAASASAWAEAKKKLTRLRTALRDNRGRALRDDVRDVLGRLLPEAGVQVSGLSFTAKGGDPVQLVDAGGNQLRLGMLSAGQRNALILAPLLRLTSDGPFGFLIVDDPVHAFDDVRVDLLADELVRLAGSRRIVVLTHDSRLHEVLLAKKPDADVRTLNRDATTGVVTPERCRQPWQVLLDDATELVKIGSLPTDLGKMPVAVRAMCRHAVDGAIRQLALRWAVTTGANLRTVAADIDRIAETWKRLKHAEGYGTAEDPSPAPAAHAVCRPYLHGWNEATHDTGGTDRVGLREEITATNDACMLLTAWGLR